jgi:dienelactone hydrolase
MKRFSLFLFSLLGAGFTFVACNDAETPKKEEEKVTAISVKEENVTYTDGTVTLNGLVAWNEADSAKRPAVLVLPEWWGINDYPKMRARQLAELGYVAFAVDIYGNGQVVDSPSLAGKMAMPFYQNPQLAKSRIDAALKKLKEYPQVDTNNIAAIGYCFGGGLAINVARMGENLKGVVSFHGSLIGTPAVKELLKAKILVCHGADDKFVAMAEVDKFKKQMDSIGADYTVNVYPGATHAFTNPNSTRVGEQFKIPIAYNAAADSASWSAMKEFFGKIFK